VDILDRDAHRLERAHGLLAQLARGVERRHREIPALVERLRRLVVSEEEVLELGADVERVEAERRHALERPAQDVTRIAVVGTAVGRDDVADHPGDLRLALLPGHELEGVRVRDRDHVRLLDRVEPGDRRAVEAHSVVEGVGDLTRGHREALEVALDVGEPEEDELHPFLLDAPADVPPRLLIRGSPAFCLDLRHA
jgi:hypothetical protein